MAVIFVRIVAISVLALTLSACSLAGPERDARIEEAAGKVLYDQYCAACHGLEGEGQPEWKSPGSDGAYPAPPHTAAGHTWHHPDQLLLEIMAKGGTMPNSAMPGFGEQLTEAEMKAILSHIKTFWGKQELEFQELVTKQYAGSGSN